MSSYMGTEKMIDIVFKYAYINRSKQKVWVILTGTDANGVTWDFEIGGTTNIGAPGTERPSPPP